ncbi:hypothetical protein NQ317_016961 [Molorchus minor]|uniref:Uncharacterized protein n=1 Tax=Molorchus minor TaxID=1323400 RepID=A0ABQ9K3Z1_9CUCU|nr:hypothetical protein NQ317_016961 [Molorchus minor]
MINNYSRDNSAVNEQYFPKYAIIRLGRLLGCFSCDLFMGTLKLIKKRSGEMCKERSVFACLRIMLLVQHSTFVLTPNVDEYLGMSGYKLRLINELFDIVTFGPAQGFQFKNLFKKQKFSRLSTPQPCQNIPILSFFRQVSGTSKGG